MSNRSENQHPNKKHISNCCRKYLRDEILFTFKVLTLTGILFKGQTRVCGKKCLTDKAADLESFCYFFEGEASKFKYFANWNAFHSISISINLIFYESWKNV